MHSPAASNSRHLLLALAGISTLMIFMTSERCFSDADINNAIGMVRTLRADATAPTLPEAMRAAHPHVEEDQIRYSGEITDSCYGFVRVRAALPGPVEPIVYLFDVNLSGQRLHPANERAGELMRRLASTEHEQAVSPR